MTEIAGLAAGLAGLGYGTVLPAPDLLDLDHFGTSARSAPFQDGVLRQEAIMVRGGEEGPSVRPDEGIPREERFLLRFAALVLDTKPFQRAALVCRLHGRISVRRHSSG